MTTCPNPIPVLIQHYGHNLATISRALGNPFKTVDRMHHLYNAALVPVKFHDRLFKLSMAEWGAQQKSKGRVTLWAIYFPHTQPHILHMLGHILNQDLSAATGYSNKVIGKILKQPKLHRRQLDRVRRQAILTIDSLASPKRAEGVDLLYLELTAALKDPDRVYPRGTIL